MKNLSKIIMVGLILAMVGLFVAYDGSQYLSLEYLKSKQEAFQSYYAENA